MTACLLTYYYLRPTCRVCPPLCRLDAAVQMPAAGAKPSPSEQLGPGRATLITGCQAHETSADACPGGEGV